MDESTSKSVKLGIFILILCVFAVLVFVWGIVNRGTIVFEGDAPFKVTILEEDSIYCESSPCRIKLIPDERSFFVEKENHRNIFVQEEIRLWRKTEVNLDFHKIPRLIKADKTPSPEEKFEYSIITEPTGTQKVVRKDDPNRTAIVYFQRKLKSPRIEGDGRFIMIFDEETVYKIDTKNRTREEMAEGDLAGVEEHKWSMDGRYLVFWDKDGEGIWILETENWEKTQMAILTDINLLDWTYDNTLVFLTEQSYENTGGSDFEGNVKVEFQDYLVGEGYMVGFYYPDENEYAKLETLEKIKGTPEEIMVLANGKELHLKMEGENFKIILRKF